MSDEPLSFEEYRQRRADSDLVRCFRCKKMILATSIRCPECGVHFQGEAQDFDQDTQSKSGTATWVIVLAVLLLLTTLVSMFGLG